MVVCCWVLAVIKISYYLKKQLGRNSPNDYVETTHKKTAAKIPVSHYNLLINNSEFCAFQIPVLECHCSQFTC